MTPNCSSAPDATASMLTDASDQLRQQLAGLVQQLQGLQQQQQQQPGAADTHSLQASHSAPLPTVAGAFQLCADPGVQVPLSRTTNAGAVLRTLSTANPRVLTLAAVAARIPSGTPQQALVLSALKDEIMHAAATLAEAPTAAAGVGGSPAPECSSAPGAAAAVQSPAVPAQAAPSDSDLQQQQQQGPLTQDALWAALMAKAAARAQLKNGLAAHPDAADAERQQQQQQQHHQQAVVPPAYGSSDSAAEAEETSCSLPWALLQAAQRAQEEEEEKAAAAAAANAASAAAGAAHADGSGAAVASIASHDSKDPAGKASNPSGPARNSSGSSQVVFRRRSTNTSNALQKHFSKPGQLQHTPICPPGKAQTEPTAVPKPQHTFKKQVRKRTLVLRANSTSNLAAAQLQHSRQQALPQPAATATQDHPAWHAAAAAAAAEGSALYGAASEPAALSASHSSLLLASAATAPAALSLSADLSEVLSCLARREQQLQLLRDQLRLQRRMLMQPTSPGAAAAATATAVHSLTGAAAPAAAGGGGRRRDSSSGGGGSTAGFVMAELQRLLSNMAAGTVPAAPTPAAATVPAAASGEAPVGADVEMTEACAPTTQALAAMLLAQLEQLVQGQPQQPQQQQQLAVSPPEAPAALAQLAALLAAQQHHQQQQSPVSQPVQAPPGMVPAAAGRALDVRRVGDLLMRLATVLQTA